MKYQTTFQELSKIFAIVAKIDTKIENYVRACGEYTEASEAYVNSDYSTSASIEMSDAFAAREKARKAMRATFQEFIKAVGMETDDCYEAESLRVAAKRDYEPRSFQYQAQNEALRLAKCVKTL